MLANYFKVALRNLLNGRLYSLINILGLGLGVCVCILILLFVRDEWSYDKFHTNADRTYRLWVKEHFQDQVLFNSITPVVLSDELSSNFPEIEHVAKYLQSPTMTRKSALTDEESVHMADPDFLEIFDFEVIDGSRNQALAGVNNVVISAGVAEKYFGEESPVGQTIELQMEEDWTVFNVTAVLENPPSNSSIQYDLIIPFENARNTLSPAAQQSWTVIYVETYAMLKEGTDLEMLESKLASFVDEKVSDSYEAGEYIVGFQPLTDIHLNTEVPAGYVSVSDSRYPWILSGIALLILILACINFTTLSIGRSLSRAKEVGVRKVTGATRNQVMVQFWTEALVTTGIAVSVGLAFASAALPIFNRLANKTLTIDITPGQILILLALAVVTGLGAGIYPSLVLSRFSPIRVIRGVVARRGDSKHAVLKWLVGAQCVISIVLIICTLVIKQQMDYLQNKNLGYNTESVLGIAYEPSGQRLSEMWPDAIRIADVMKNDLAATGVTDIATSSHAPGSIGWLELGYVEEGTDRFRQFQVQQVSPNYVDMMEVSLVEGRNFTREAGTDMKAVIINESMASAWGWEDPVGQTLPGPYREYQIIGVARDFHFASLHNPIGPLAMVKDFIPLFVAAPDRNWTDTPSPKLLMKLKSENLRTILPAIESMWKTLAPGQTFAYEFVDDQIGTQYEAEQRLSRLLGIATGMAILIACMGLFGIGLLTIARRTKEIGVRRVLGASAMHIVLMLNKQFSVLVLIGVLIATPIAWYAMQEWLQDFAYRIQISPFVFVLAGIIALVLVWISIGYQTIRAALSNPVKALRDL